MGIDIMFDISDFLRFCADPSNDGVRTGVKLGMNILLYPIVSTTAIFTKSNKDLSK
jgi:hypothetical protein